MANELPFFKFVPSEWCNDDIALESFEVKGLFMDICAWYWQRDCSITQALLKRRFEQHQALLEQLFKSGFIKVKNDSDFIEIKFLDVQFDELSEKRKRRQEAGSKGGKQSSSNAKAMVEQGSSNKNKKKNKKKNRIPTLFEVIEYAKEKGFSAELATRAFNHYDAADWHDRNGDPVSSWKQKILTNWFKPENKPRKGRAAV